VAQYREFAGRLGLADITPIPLSAVHGDNVIAGSGNMPWYSGPTLLRLLETVEVDAALAGRPFRLPVQWGNRPNAELRGFSGLIADGTVHRGDRLRALPSGRESRVARIVTADGDLEAASAGQSVTLTLDAEIDISRGDVLAAADAPPQVADQ